MDKAILNCKRATYWPTSALAFFLFAGLAAPAQAQPQVPATIRLSPEDSERGQYGAQRNFFFLPPGKAGEENYLNAGFFGQKLRPYLSSSPTAVSELDKYRRQKTLFLIDKGLTLSGVIVYATQAFGHGGEAQYFNSTQQVAAGVIVASLVATLFINHRTNSYLQQAVDNYNTDPPSSKRHGALWPRLRPAGCDVATTPQGQPVVGLRWQL